MKGFSIGSRIPFGKKRRFPVDVRGLERQVLIYQKNNINGWWASFDDIPDSTPTGETQSFKTIQNQEQWKNMFCFSFV